MIIEAHKSPRSLHSKYTLFDKTGKAELIEGRIHFDAAVSGQRVNPFKDPSARLNADTRDGSETIYILGHGGGTLLAGETAQSWAAILVRMGLMANDTCAIDITACYVGVAPTGFAGTLTAELANRNIKCKVTGPQGHIHATTTHTAIFTPKSGSANFYDACWTQAGHADQGDSFTRAAAVQLCNALPTQCSTGEVIALYSSFLLELRKQVAPAIGLDPGDPDDAETYAELKAASSVLKQLDAMPGQEDMLAHVACLKLADFMESGPVEFSSAFISAIKRAYKTAQHPPPALAQARTDISNEANRVWLVHKSIIENQEAVFTTYIKATPSQRSVFDSDDLEAAKRAVTQLITVVNRRPANELKRGDWLRVAQLSSDAVNGALKTWLLPNKKLKQRGQLKASFAKEVGAVLVECPVSIDKDMRKIEFKLKPLAVGFTWTKPKFV